VWEILGLKETISDDQGKSFTDRFKKSGETKDDGTAIIKADKGTSEDDNDIKTQRR
jgi:hypothetical protein